MQTTRIALYVLAGCVITTLVASQLLRVFDVTNVVMVFLMNVVIAALYWGRGAGALSALLSVGCLDFFFVPPVWSFHVSDTQYLFTFVLMLAVALVTGHLMAELRERTRRAAVRIEGEKLRNALLASVSHDLRTPLAAIRGMAGVMGDGELPRAIAAQADSMQRQIANLLDTARMQDGGARLDRQWHALDELVGVALAEARLGERHVVLALSPDLPLVDVDAVMFDRVLANLLDNAGKYTPSDATLCIRGAYDGTHIRLHVEDDGPGFPAGVDPATMFTAFERGERESTVPGVGLGLSLARRIMQAHGGAISASRRYPSGAVFTLTLPRGQPPAIEREPMP
ncbi:DUF4118 domain-containing protein [Luteibacter pinisoli]|uniref:histidine kinase n=1 Tax=Luteibacter pinisoli TaxID=2589080 RepID=A0A4Y5Z7V4_9GAMM|nr:DUF4118 domain-containing protein [Luteibacter pinisoli]QDE41314.1 DUF4118 domain-containing protein [Luteibacter pinisoli]